MRGRPWHFPAGVAAACIVSACIGHALAPREKAVSGGKDGTSSGSGAAAAGPSPLAGNTSDRTATGGRHQPRTERELAQLKERITKSFVENPNADTDFILRSTTANLLATMSAEELRAFFSENKGMPTEVELFDPTWQVCLSREILRQWGLKDPGAASIASTPYNAGADVFGDWMKRDPAAAEKWLMSAEGPQGEVRARLLESYVKEQGRRDPNATGALLGKLEPEARENILRGWSKDLGNDPDGRLKLLALVDASGDETLREKCYGDIVTTMTRRSPEEAANFLESSPLPEESKNRMMDRLIGSWAILKPDEAFRWWASLKEEEPRESLLSPLREWYFKDRKAPGDWINTLPAGPARTRYEETTINHLTHLEDFGNATRVAANIADDEARIRQMKIIRRIWEERSEAGAAVWLKTLPEKDRQAVMK